MTKIWYDGDIKVDHGDWQEWFSQVACATRRILEAEQFEFYGRYNLKQRE